MIPLRSAVYVIAAIALTLASPTLWCQEAEPPPEPVEEAPAAEPLELRAAFDFEGEAIDASWSTLDPDAVLALAHDPENVAKGGGALEFAYTAGNGAFQQLSSSAFGTPTANVLSLKVKATSPTSISLGVEEEDGAAYQALLSIAADKWVAVDVPLDELILSQNAQDADPGPAADQIRGFFIADLANLGGEAGRALGLKEGDQRLWLDDVALIDAGKVTRRSRVEKRGDGSLLVADSFEGDVRFALPIRQAELTFVKGAPQAQGKQALEMTYDLAAGRWAGFVCAPPGRLDLSGGTGFHMWARTDLNARLVIVLEERDMTKYETATKVAPDDTWHEVEIPFTDFVLDDAAPDPNRELNPGQIHRIIILVDTFDADVRPGGKGSVIVDDIAIVSATAPEAP